MIIIVIETIIKFVENQMVFDLKHSKILLKKSVTIFIWLSMKPRITVYRYDLGKKSYHFSVNGTNFSSGRRWRSSSVRERWSVVPSGNCQFYY